VLQQYSIQNIAGIIHANFTQHATETSIAELLIDSRAITNADTSLFFAIVGQRNNGHKYINELYQKGVRNFVVQAKVDVSKLHNANILEVKDTLHALQMLATHKRRQFQIPVIGITGSNGKTIIKEWLYQLLYNNNTICRSPKSYNSQVGVPLSVWQLNNDDTLGIFEAGISQKNEMQLLENIIKPTIGVFTNIGNAHNEGFENTQQKAHEKFKLFQHAECLIYCKDYENIHTEVLDYNAQHSTEKQLKTFCWSRKTKADLVVGKISTTNNNTHIQGIYNNSFLEIEIPFIDSASIENAIHCWCVMLHVGIEQQKIQEQMLQLTPVAMRLELKEGINNCVIVNDFYNSDINSLSIALDYLNAQPLQKKTLIISDIFQSGMNSEELYAKVASLIKAKNIERVIGIGSAIKKHIASFATNAQSFENTDEFITHFKSETFHNEAILLKGSRQFQFERISQLLQQKSHETILEINLNAVLNNYIFYRSKLKPNVKVMAMVKAFSYGSGSYEVANLLQYNRVNYLAVAYADEGVELRKRGIKTPIMVMNVTADSFDKILEYNLEPEIYCKRLLTQICAWAKTKINHINQFPIHLKIDSGMHRLGFIESEIEDAMHSIKINGLLTVKSVFSHLVASDNQTHDEFTHQQINTFENCCSIISSQLNYTFEKHILNSGGITRFVDAQYDMVRLGIGLYGISNNDLEKPFLENVCTLKTIISQIKLLEMGDTVGYSRNGKISQPTKIATLPIGYADGFGRKLGNGNFAVLINNKKAKTIGNICMDMCMVDVTDIDCNEGDEAIIFGQNAPIIEYASALETISYEALTSVSERVKRVYMKE
jgi:Alr-MurF fusion protein